MELTYTIFPPDATNNYTSYTVNHISNSRHSFLSVLQELMCLVNNLSRPLSVVGKEKWVLSLWRDAREEGFGAPEQIVCPLIRQVIMRLRQIDGDGEQLFVQLYNMGQ